MIGVVAKTHQMPVVEEFFQLFKTPWELCEQGRIYDVVVATADGIPDVETKLLVVYGPELRTTDAGDGVVTRSRQPGASLEYRGFRLPIYGDVVTFEESSRSTPCVTGDMGVAGLRVKAAGHPIVMRLGYDLFDEVERLISIGQPVENADIPTLDRHIMMLREWILNAGVALWEIPPTPAGYSAVVCLTHDIDFAGIRYHKFDHTMWGFLYRATFGAVRKFARGRLSGSRLVQSWGAAASLPLVYAGWAKDFWEPFGWYLRVERHLPATYFLIPFKGQSGDNVTAPHATRRAAAYDVADLSQWTQTLLAAGCELGVHGIDAWHSAKKGSYELDRVAEVTGESRIGIRMHWLLRGKNTFRVLEQAGYDYDSSLGYNETVGYLSGTTQVFRPSGARRLLELPLHIQDGALFFPDRLDLCEAEAWSRCEELIDHVRRSGGVLTILWHDRSHGPERFWGDFYIRLVASLRSLPGWFGTAGQVVDWFRERREVRFERVEPPTGGTRVRLRYDGDEIQPPVTIRSYRPGVAGNDEEMRGEVSPELIDISWNGKTALDLESCWSREKTEPAVGATCR